MVYDFYTASCVFSIPEPWRGDKKPTPKPDIFILRQNLPKAT